MNKVIYFGKASLLTPESYAGLGCGRMNTSLWLSDLQLSIILFKNTVYGFNGNSATQAALTVR